MRLFAISVALFVYTPFATAHLTSLPTSSPLYSDGAIVNACSGQKVEVMAHTARFCISNLTFQEDFQFHNHLNIEFEAVQLTRAQPSDLDGDGTAEWTQYSIEPKFVSYRPASIRAAYSFIVQHLLSTQDNCDFAVISQDDPLSEKGEEIYREILSHFGYGDDLQIRSKEGVERVYNLLSYMNPGDYSCTDGF